MTRGAFKHHSARCSGQKTTQIGITSLFIPYADIIKGEAIGKGQFGTVHLCQWKNKGDNEPVAVKVKV
jgi:predicted Ser/Thr protein kinase